MYCNYSKDKFGNELTFIIPPWEELDEEDANSFLTLVAAGAKMNEEGKKAYPFYRALQFSEAAYLQMLDNGYTPQQARQVLPNALKTEICMCGFEKVWEHFFALRYYGITGKPHPSMYEVAEMLKFGFEEKGINF